jgi:archaellum biogenesis ATPase FlaH
MEGIKRIDELEGKVIRRISTDFEQFDKIIGTTHFSNMACELGLPRGYVSVWSGEPGVGKSRFVTQISKNTNNYGYLTIVFQGEVSLSEYKNWIGDIKYPQWYYVSNTNTINEQISEIDEVATREKISGLVIIDSINMLEGFNSPETLRDIIRHYKEIAIKHQLHVIIIAHQNKEGEVKGNTDLSYLVDNVFMLDKYVPPKKIVAPSGKVYKFDEIQLTDKEKEDFNSMFVVTVKKNRGGVSGGLCVFKHTNKGVIYAGNTTEIKITEVFLPEEKIEYTETPEIPEPIVGVDINLKGKPIKFCDRVFFKIFGDKLT